VNTVHKSHIQPAALQDAVSTNHVLIHDVEMNRDEVSQNCVKHFPAMLKHSTKQPITALYSKLIDYTEVLTLKQYIPYFTLSRIFQNLQM